MLDAARRSPGSAATPPAACPRRCATTPRARSPRTGRRCAPSGVSLDATKDAAPRGHPRRAARGRAAARSCSTTSSPSPTSPDAREPGDPRGRRAAARTSSGRARRRTRPRTVTVDGLAEWRSPWSEIARRPPARLRPGDRAGLPGAGDAAAAGRVDRVRAPLRPARSTRPCADRVVERAVRPSAGRPPPAARLDDDRPAARALARVGGVRRPRRARADPRQARRRTTCRSCGPRTTSRRTTRRPEVYDPIYAAWARGGGGGDPPQRLGPGDACWHRYDFGPDVPARGDPARPLRRDVGRGRPARPGHGRGALGLEPCRGGCASGIVGAPRADKLVQAVIDGVAACDRDDVQLVVLVARARRRPCPDDPRIAIAEPYRGCDPATYATRLAACDVLALVFDPDGDMLATGTAADAQRRRPPRARLGVGLPGRGARRRRHPLRPHRRVDRRRHRRPDAVGAGGRPGRGRAPPGPDRLGRPRRRRHGPLRARGPAPPLSRPGVRREVTSGGWCGGGRDRRCARGRRGRPPGSSRCRGTGPRSPGGPRPGA